ncbi:MAG: four helix bundle protein [Phycisphaerales bacterium]|nr:four helix bundle protein [Phycisphaerales bacterium]
MGTGSYRELDVWRVAIDLVAEVYRVTQTWPAHEQFGLISQVRRAAVSIPSNIAEGYGRESRKDYIRSLRIARGSLAELETQLVISGRVGISNREELRPAWEFSQRVGAMLTALIRWLKRPDRTPSPDSRLPIPDSRPPEEAP